VDGHRHTLNDEFKLMGINERQMHGDIKNKKSHSPIDK
jgi:hypothetical protein